MAGARLLKESLIYGVSAALSALVGFVLLPVYTRAFTPAEYGVLAQINATTNFAAIFTIFGLDNSAAVWFWDRPSEEERRRTFTSWLAFTLVVGALVATLAVLGRNVLATRLFGDAGYAHLWLYFAANALLFNLSKIANIWFRSVRRPVVAVALAIVPPTVACVLGVLLVRSFHLGLSGALAAQVAASTMGAVVTVLSLRSVLRVRAVDLGRLRAMLAFSSPLVLMTGLSWLMGSAVVYVVGFTCSPADAGLYQVGNSLASVVGIAAFAFTQAWTPHALSIRDEEEARRTYGLATEASAVAGLVVAFASAAFAVPALRVVARPQYEPAESVLSLLAANNVLLALPQVFSVTFAVRKRSLPLAKATALGAAVTVVTIPLLSRWHGKEGAALAVLAGSTTLVVAAFRDSQRIMPIDVRLGRLGLATATAAVWAVAFALVRQLDHDSGLPVMILTRMALTLSLIVALAVLYRHPLRSLWRAFRARRVQSASTA